MSRSSLPALLGALVLIAVLAPSGAGAATWCAGSVDPCPGTVAPTVQAALDAAATVPGRDTVLVGCCGQEPGGFTVAAGNAVDVKGVDGAPYFLDGAAQIAVGEPTAVISGLTVIPTDPVPGTAPIDLAAGTLEHTRVWATGDPAVRLGAGTLRDVQFPFSARDAVGVQAVGPGGLVEDSALFGPTALISSSDALVVRRSEVQGFAARAGAAAMTVTGGGVVLDDVVVDVFGDGSGTFDGAGTTALDVAPAAASAGVDLRNVTVRGGDPPWLGTGLRAACGAGGTASVTLLDTVAFGFGIDLQRTGAGCAMSLDHTRYGTRDAGGGVFGDGPGVSSGPVGPFAADIAPGHESPLIDAGSARSAPEVDYLGRRRVADGDGDGVAVRDIGAIEYQRAAPVARMTGAAQAFVGELQFISAADSSDDDLGDEGRLRFGWTVDGAPVPAGDSGELLHTFTAVGRHTVALTVTDPTDQHSTVSAPIDVVAAPADPAPAGPGRNPSPAVPVAPPGDAVAPAVTNPPGPGIEARLAGRRPVRGAVAVRVTCTVATICRGTVALRAVDHGRAVTVGRSGRFAVRRGHPVAVRVPLVAAGRRLLRRHKHGLDLRVIVLFPGGGRWTEGQGGRLTP